MRFKLNLLILFLLPCSLFAQEEEIEPQEYIKTITFKGDTPESQLPILRLGQQLTLEFDVLNGDEADFYYEIRHYNFDWTPSILVESEYLNGFNEQRIRYYENSFNTFQMYSHYLLTIPNRQTRGLKISGNYMITIYNDDDEIEFTRKFMVFEDYANVGVAVRRSRDVAFVNEKQSIDVAINSSTIRFNNPKETIKTAIVKNNNLKTAITDLKPQYILGNELQYRYVEESSFFGGNEFFFFENKDLRAANNAIQFIDLDDIYNHYLFTNISRADLPYTYNPDINGNFLITALDRDKPRIEADYAKIHFALELDQLPEGESVHVYGNFNNYSVDNSTKMEYNTEKNTYESSLLLKQGFYNYKYVIKKEDGTLDENTISGSFYQTENNYKVLVYYRDLGARYDRLIGIGEANSVNITN